VDGMCQWFRHLPLKDFPFFQDAAPYFYDWLAHPDDDDYWAQWNIEKHYHKIRIPACNLGGWYDIFLGGTIRNGFVARISLQARGFLCSSELRCQRITLRHSELGHTIQGRGPQKEFRRLLRELTRPQRRPKDRLEPKDGRLGHAPPMIARFLLPPLAPQAPNHPEILIPLPRLSRAVPMLPDLRIPPGRDRPLGFRRFQGFIHFALVLRPIRTHLRNRTVPLFH
jgi:hypothetical protein